MSNLKWTIGNVRITRILERESSAKINSRFPAATPEAIAAYREWLVPHFLDDNDEFLFSIQSLLIQSMGRNIIVDTCAGENETSYLSGFKLATRSFLDDLAKAGFPRESIDVVICTHLHDDHVGWNTMKSGTQWVPTFPNARYLFVQGEYKRCLAKPGHIFYSTFSKAVEPIVVCGQAELIEVPYQATDEIRLEATPGHTPWHMSVWVESDVERALITGDATHHPVQWAEPDWGIVAEDDPITSAQTRRRLLQEYIKRPYLIIGTHYSTPCAGRLETNGQETRFNLSS
jgi:glyoxylase-like metal-dependent hydrolase (beta-lactamase superfamily II)